MVRLRHPVTADQVVFQQGRWHSGDHRDDTDKQPLPEDPGHLISLVLRCILKAENGVVVDVAGDVGDAVGEGVAGYIDRFPVHREPGKGEQVSILILGEQRDVIVQGLGQRDQDGTVEVIRGVCEVVLRWILWIDDPEWFHVGVQPEVWVYVLREVNAARAGDSDLLFDFV